MNVEEIIQDIKLSVNALLNDVYLFDDYQVGNITESLLKCETELFRARIKLQRTINQK